MTVGDEGACLVFVASDACAVLHNKKTDLQFKGHKNYVDEKCISTPC
jgi:hypothetical protein